MIRINYDDLETIEYPSGEWAINFKSFRYYDAIHSDEILFEWELHPLYWEREIIQILLLKNHFKAFPGKKYILEADFIPFARDDKPYKDSNFIMIWQFINLLDFDEIITTDIHGLETLADKTLKIETKLNNKYDNYGEFYRFLKEELSIHDSEMLICYPDMTAYTKFHSIVDDIKEISLSNHLFIGSVIFEKVRDSQTGKIYDQQLKYINIDCNNFDHEQTEHNVKLIIIDDICSYGTTFINASEITKKVVSYFRINIESTKLITIYDEEQQKSFDFKNEIDEHVYHTIHRLKPTSNY